MKNTQFREKIIIFLIEYTKKMILCVKKNSCRQLAVRAFLNRATELNFIFSFQIFFFAFFVT